MKKILFFLLISNYIFAQWSISNAERSALMSLYNSTNGEHWSTVWDFQKDPKTWYGIKIKNGFVTEINLRGNALKGNFPANLSVFSHLEKLDFSSNQLQGEISQELSSLSYLVRLDVSNNRLSGDPSAAVSSLAQLKELSLGDNNFSVADIEAFLQNFSQLEILNLAHFGLTSVPVKISLNQRLQSLNLSNNNISQNFQTLSGLVTLSEINLSGNQLTAIPSGLPNTVKSLDISNNLFSNNYSAALSNLKNLEWLSLENNQINTFPSELSQLTKLVHLNFGRNTISGGTSTLLSLSGLQQLFLNNNLFSGDFPADLLQLPQLQMLSLSSNQLSGNIPQNIPAVTFIENNRFTEVQIRNFLDNAEQRADFVYSPQRYDEEKTIEAYITGPANLTQSLSGSDYTYTWLKALDQNIDVHTPNYYISSVQAKDYDVYTCEAYFLKNYPNYLLEISFFREPITLLETMGTEEATKNINIYPNPTKDYLHIRTENMKMDNATIYDFSGKLLFTTKKNIIDVRHLPSGVYAITIETRNGRKIFKWIKE